MAVDLQLIQPQESIKLDQVRLTRLGGLKAVHLRAHDFRAVDEVLINDVPSPDVVVLSQFELIAQLPDTMQEQPDVRSVLVLSNRFTLSPRSLIRFRLGRTPGKVTGMLRLVQLFLKILFQTAGTDIFNRGSGGSALKHVGETFGQDEGQSVLTEFVIAVNRTQRQLIAMQSRDQRSPRTERLLSANVTGSQYDKSAGALYVRVELISQAGKSALANVEL